MNENTVPSQKNIKSPILLISVFIIAICGILYELLISTISSYFQGSSILHFSIIIGLFLSFMGVGSYLSRFIQKNLLGWFIQLEIILGIVGGLSTLILYFAFSLTPYFYGITFLVIGILGGIIGVEIPLLTRIVRNYESLRQAVSDVLSFDYFGALLASLLFPLILLPNLGTMKTAFVVGMLNISVAILNTWLFRKELKNFSFLFGLSWISMVGLIAGFIFSFQLVSYFEQFLYRDQIIYSKQTAYQKLVLTKWNQDTRLFINGNLQFSSQDEYRYHEALVHIPMLLSENQEKVLILGGGDGMAVREVLKYEEVQKIDLVDLDPEMTRLGEKHPIFQKLNKKSMLNPKLKVYNEDAYKFLENSSEYYSVIIIDLPDPHETSLGKLYSKSFYGILKKRLAMGGTFVTQSTSPYYAPRAFWCINKTVESEFDYTLPYRTYVPAFGEWGFNLGKKTPQGSTNSLVLSKEIETLKLNLAKKKETTDFRYLNENMLEILFYFDEDTKKIETNINKLDNQSLIHYYEKSWDYSNIKKVQGPRN
ncbi:MAG: polyamine aminopropyltransferase [Bacteroidia bacterium]|nr:polyamine aminopropyltransferase [Bacteroidia bacterium]